MNVKCTYTFRFWFVGIRKKEHYQIVHDFFRLIDDMRLSCSLWYFH